MTYEYYSQRYDISEDDYNALAEYSDNLNRIGIYGDHISTLLMTLGQHRALKPTDNVPLITITQRARECIRRESGER